MPSSGIRGWIGPIIVTIIGGLLRFIELGRPHAIIFDETYYPKSALGMLDSGYEKKVVENANDLILESDGNWRVLDLFTGDPEFVVHPPLGKWTIAIGEQLFGATPFGWRFAVAVLGTLAILMTARIARRLTRSDLIGTLAGLLLAVEGMHLVMSRSGLLDMVLAFWVLAAFGLLLIDRDRTRGRLAELVRRDGLAAVSTTWGPRLGLRPWRWAAALALGLACSVKWSGLWFLAFFILMSLVWDVSTQACDRGAPAVARDDPARRSRRRPVDGGDRHRRLPDVVDRLVRHRRRLCAAVGRGPAPLARSPRHCGRCGTTTRRRGGSTSD